MNSKFPKKREESDPNIFSKVITGMKSVFNNASKKPKKPVADVAESPTKSSKADKRKDVVIPSIKIQIDDIQDEEIVAENAYVVEELKVESGSNVVNILDLPEFQAEDASNENPDDPEERIPEYAMYTINPDSPRFNENVIMAEVPEENFDEIIQEPALEERQVEEKQVEVRQVEESQVEERQVEERQVEERQMEERQVEKRQIEEGQVEGKGTDVVKIKEVLPIELEKVCELLVNKKADTAPEKVSFVEEPIKPTVLDVLPQLPEPVAVLDESRIGDEKIKDMSTPVKKKTKNNQKKKARKKDKSKDRDEINESDEDVSESVSESKKTPKTKSDSNTDESDIISPNKPRIVLTFRSEKTGLRSTNVKIITETVEERTSPVSRRSLRSKTTPSIFESGVDDNKRELRRKLHVPITDNDHCDSKSTKSGNSDTDDSLRTPPSAKRHRRSKPSSVHSDSNSEDSPPAVKDRMIKRSARRSLKEHSDNILANAIARKEKSYEASTSGPTRLSRRIKPTAKVLANRELRLGFESQNNARLALISEKPIPSEDCKITRSRMRKSPEKCKLSDMLAPKGSKAKKQLKMDTCYDYKRASSDDEKLDMNQGRQYLSVDDINRCILGNVLEGGIKPKLHIQKVGSRKKETSPSEAEDLNETEEEKELKRLNRLKKKHLRKLGLKAVNSKNIPYLRDREVVTDESTMDSTNTEAVVEHINARSKIFEFRLQPSEVPEKEEGDQLSLEEEELVIDESRLEENVENNKVYQIHIPDTEENIIKQEMTMEVDDDEQEDDMAVLEMQIAEKLNSLPECKFSLPVSYNSAEQNGNVNKSAINHLGSPSIGDSGTGAASQPEGTSSLMACLCINTSNVYHDPFFTRETEYCRAADTIGSHTIGCGRPALPGSSLSRAGHRAPFFLPCEMHLRRLRMHQCCAGCGLFCTQGQFQQCSEGHLFHGECALPWRGPAPPRATRLPCCPHCGPHRPVTSSTVRLQMRCNQPMLLLESPRLQFMPNAKVTYKHKVPETKTFESMESLIKSLGLDLPILPSDQLPQLRDGVIARGAIDYDDVLMKTAELSRPSADLLAAICDGEDTVEKIILALVAGADPRRPIIEADEGSCLHLAAREFNLRAMHIFKVMGCELDAYDKKQRTPLMLAIISYDTKMKQLEEREETLKNVIDPSEIIIEQFKPEKIKEIREAYRVEFYAVLKYLVKAGADVTLKGPEGVSALHLAAKNSDVAACSMILESHTGIAKSFINQRDDGGWTPLVWAAENKNLHIVRYLLERGSDPMVRDTENNVALHWAGVAGCGGSMEALLNHHTPVNITNVHGDTPLHISARQEHYNCVIILLARGAKFDALNNLEETPLDCVCDESSRCFAALSINIQLQSIAAAFSKPERIVTNDLSNGKEPYAVQCVNNIDDENIENHFTYVSENCFTVDIDINRKITSMEACHCKGRCGQGDRHCSCAAMSVESWYDIDGRLVPHFDYEDPPMIFECNDACSCNKLLCINRGLSRPRPSALQVFRRKSRGARGVAWAVRPLRPLSRGSLVCEFVGEIIPACLAYELKHDAFIVDLQVNNALQEKKKEAFCIDATHYGNVSRFINHKCEPNLVAVKVFVQHRDVRFPRIALFACRDIQVGEELGYDYGDKFWAVYRKTLICNCESATCRYNILLADVDTSEDGKPNCIMEAAEEASVTDAKFKAVDSLESNIDDVEEIEDDEEDVEEEFDDESVGSQNEGDV